MAFKTKKMQKEPHENSRHSPYWIITRWYGFVHVGKLFKTCMFYRSKWSRPPTPKMDAGGAASMSWVASPRQYWI